MNITLPSYTHCPFCNHILQHDRFIPPYKSETEYVLYCKYNNSNCSKYEALYDISISETPIFISFYFAHADLTITNNNTWEIMDNYKDIILAHGNNAIELFNNLTTKQIEEVAQTILLYS